MVLYLKEDRITIVLLHHIHSNINKSTFSYDIKNIEKYTGFVKSERNTATMGKVVKSYEFDKSAKSSQFR